MKFHKHKQHSTLLTLLTYHKHFEIEAKLTFFSGPILNSRTPNQLFRAGKKHRKDLESFQYRPRQPRPLTKQHIPNIKDNNLKGHYFNRFRR
tara:strand:+ start:25 stop:300 length:276 start_codon:yes stop_codon:yes gene_type:complete